MQRTTAPDATRKPTATKTEPPAARGAKIDRGEARERGYDEMAAALTPGAYFEKVGRTMFGTPHPPRDSRWGAYVKRDGQLAYAVVRASWQIVEADGTPYVCDESTHQDIKLAELTTCQLVAYDFEDADPSYEEATSLVTSAFERRISEQLPGGARVKWTSVTLEMNDQGGAAKSADKGQAPKPAAKGQAAHG